MDLWFFRHRSLLHRHTHSSRNNKQSKSKNFEELLYDNGRPHVHSLLHNALPEIVCDFRKSHFTSFVPPNSLRKKNNHSLSLSLSLSLSHTHTHTFFSLCYRRRPVKRSRMLR
ncbi:hypothetical protein QVD17_30185 [Tagetes erecta]|uniref:Uncharacterized protein n=1 Tax=Tagetes erecta TaxID=13708 RepID=A0AAD8K3Q2_TARER|nr:hypothetical protein QVD17_30185 [Tagetes erecta]